MAQEKEEKREKRDEEGKFLPGHCGGPGRGKDPDNAKVLRRALIDAATIEQVIAVIAKVYEQATTDRFDKDGCNLGADMGAARLFLDRIIGLPRQQIEIEGGSVISSIQLAFIGTDRNASASIGTQQQPAINGNGNGNGLHRLPPE